MTQIKLLKFYVLVGIINTFIYTFIGYLWLFLTIMIFWKVWFPTNAKNAEIKGYMKFIHITIVTFSIVLSAIPVDAELGTGGYMLSVFSAFASHET